MRAFTILALPLAVMAADPVIKAGGPQDPPTIPGTLFPTNTTGLHSTPTGNLSITRTTSSSSSTSESVVLITTSQSGGAVTLTSFVGASPTGNPTTTGIGQTQPGAASKVGNSAIGALALAVGVGAFFL